MINFRKEGELVKHGINFYHVKDESSIGMLLRIKGTIWCLRFSKFTRKFSYIVSKIAPI